MADNWFRPKTFGWGWTPASKEGWITTIAAVLILYYLWTSFHNYVYVIAFIIALCVFCDIKSKPRLLIKK